MKQKNYDSLSKEILGCIGGKENIIQVSHCLTRLRFKVKDQSLIQENEIKELDGVMGIQWSGLQFHVIIGTDVDKMYNSFIAIADINNNGTEFNENTETNRKFSLKSIGKSIINSLSGSVTPLLPLIIGASLFKVVTTICGPNLLGWLQEGSDLYVLFNMVGDAGFYFLPIFTAYSASKQFNTSPVISMLLCSLLLHPMFNAMVEGGTEFTVYGIPVLMQSYANAIIPSILSVWVLSYVERFFEKYIPKTMKVVLVPFFSLLVMLPVLLCVMGPLGNMLGSLICNFVLGLSDKGGILGILAMAFIGATHQLLVLTGMHHVLMAALMVVLASEGYDTTILPSMIACGAACWGMAAGAALRLKDKKEKGLAVSYLITGAIGGITEPILYGIGLKYKRPLIGMISGGAVGAAFMGIFHVTCYSVYPVANVLMTSMFLGAETGNFVVGCIGALVAFIVSIIVTYTVGFEKKEA